jgi:hypothetical protein
MGFVAMCYEVHRLMNNEAHEGRKLTNPARRLYNILADTSATEGRGKHFRNYLAAKLGGDEKNDLDMFRKLLGVYDLVALTDRRLSTMKHHKRDTYASCIKPIVTTLQHMQLNSPAHQIHQQLGTGPLNILDLASEALDEEQPELLIEQTALDALYADAEQLEAKIESAGLPTELRVLLVNSIDRIKAAIRNYTLGGAEGLDRAIKEAYGAAFVEHAVVLPEKDNPIVHAFWDWLGKINATVSACKTAYATGLIATDVVIHLLEYFKH